MGVVFNSHGVWSLLSPGEMVVRNTSAFPCDYCGGFEREAGRTRCLSCGAPTVPYDESDLIEVTRMGDAKRSFLLPDNRPMRILK